MCHPLCVRARACVRACVPVKYANYSVPMYISSYTLTMFKITTPFLAFNATESTLFYESRKRKRRQQAVQRQYMQRRRQARSAHERHVLQQTWHMRASYIPDDAGAQRKAAFYRVDKEFAPSRALHVRWSTLAHVYPIYMYVVCTHASTNPNCRHVHRHARIYQSCQVELSVMREISILQYVKREREIYARRKAPCPRLRSNREC